MKPVVDRLEKEYEGRIEFRRYNVESDQEGIQLANRVRVTAVPTFLFVNSDGVRSAITVGSMTEAQLREKLDALK